MYMIDDMEQLEVLLSEFHKYFPNGDKVRLGRAYELLSQNLDSEKKNVILGLVSVLFSLPIDENTIIVVFLQVFSRQKLKEIGCDVKEQFGEDVSQLLDSLHQIGQLRCPQGDQESIENFRKFFLVIAKDLRVVLIKMAIFVQALEANTEIDSKSSKDLAWEAMNVYVWVAARLGIYKLKCQLEDLSFRYLYPKQYQEIVEEVERKQSDRQIDIQKMRLLLEEILQKEGVEAEVYARVKHAYGIYLKLKRKGKTILNDILDFFALRIVLPDIWKNGEPFYGHCYHVLGLLYDYLEPFPNRFKDYIAAPKINGYRSLHTTVKGFALREGLDVPVELQIRTQAMEEEANYGLAAHWLYKYSNTHGFTPKARGYTFPSDSKQSIQAVLNAKSGQEMRSQLQEEIQWFQVFQDIQKSNANDGSLGNRYHLNFFPERVFVLTKDGKVKDLPQGSTPVDLAYALNDSAGHTLSLARVNDRIVPLDYNLKNGDKVEIVSKTYPSPNRYWLSFVKSEKAKLGIALFYEQFDRERQVNIGKSLKEFETAGRPQREISDTSLALTKKITVFGEANIPFRISSCCNPEFGMEICGYITRGKGITVHTRRCSTILALEKERLIDLYWQGQEPMEAENAFKLYLKLKNETPLINEILDFLLKNKVKISQLNTNRLETEEDVIEYEIEIVVKAQDYDLILDYLRGIQGVFEVAVK